MRPRSFGSVLAAACFLALGCGDSDGGGAATETDASTGTNTMGPTSVTPTSATMSGGPTSATMTTMPPATDSADTGTTTGEPECPYDEVPGDQTVALELVANGFDRPMLALGHPTEPDRLFVVEQGGNVKILEPGTTSAPAENFLSVDVNTGNPNSIGNERGLLGFAFHPEFPDDPRVYVAYNPNNGEGSPPTFVEEYTLGADGNADPATARPIYAADQPAGNHNGGMIAFGPDGYLYIGNGDGGDAGDSFNTGRNPAFHLAKMIRIDVEPDGTPDDPVSCGPECSLLGGSLGPFDYTIPPDNPFVDDPTFAPEIWAWGFRNPWRFSFDPVGGALWLGDVGQGEWEEIHVVEAGNDYGWSDMEGNNCYPPGNGDCDPSAEPNQPNAQGQIAPIVEYSHGGGRCSVTGLSVYRSCQVPAWDGLYFFGDYCTGQIWAVAYDGTNVTVANGGETVWESSDEDRILGGGWNAYGDVFVTTVRTPFANDVEDGYVYRVVPAM